MAKKSKEEIERKKRLAYTLYVVNGFDQRVIAEITEISERSISNWKQEGKWDEDREEQRMGFEPQRKRLRQLFNRQLEIIDGRDHPENIANNSESDRLNKLADAAKKLQTELSYQHKAEAGKQFITFVQQTYGQAKAVEVVELWHAYLMATV